MEKLQKAWLRLVAPGVLRELDQLEKSRAEWEEQFDNQVEVVKQWTDEARRLQKGVDSLQRELNKLQATPQDPYRGCIDHNARHASQTRIRDLEAQLRKHGIEPQ